MIRKSLKMFVLHDLPRSFQRSHRSIFFVSGLSRGCLNGLLIYSINSSYHVISDHKARVKIILNFHHAHRNHDYVLFPRFQMHDITNVM